MTVHPAIPAARRPNWKIAAGIPALIFLACIVISVTTTFRHDSSVLSNALLADMLLTAPLIYFLAIRKTGVPKITVARVFILGLLLAGFLINARPGTPLQFIQTWIAPAVEGLVIIFIINRFRLARKSARQGGTGKADFLLYCRHFMQQVTGSQKAGNIMGSEISVLYYSFAGSPDRAVDYKTTFSIYRQSGIRTVLGAILFLFVIETAGMHFLIDLWSPVAAWVVTGFSAYTCLQLFAPIRALGARSTFITPAALEIHSGLACDVTIPLGLVEKIEASKKQQIGPQAVKIALLKGL